MDPETHLAFDSIDDPEGSPFEPPTGPGASGFPSALGDLVTVSRPGSHRSGHQDRVTVPPTLGPALTVPVFVEPVPPGLPIGVTEKVDHDPVLDKLSELLVFATDYLVFATTARPRNGPDFDPENARNPKKALTEVAALSGLSSPSTRKAGP